MIELVELLCQLVAVVGYSAGRVVLAGLSHHLRELAELLHESHLGGVEGRLKSGKWRVESGERGFCPGSLAQYGAYAGMSVLDEGARVAVEVDALLGVEEHILARVDLQNKVFQGTHSHDAGYLVALLGRDALELVHLVLAHLACVLNHLSHQVVGIDHRSLARFHLSVGQFHHSVAEVDQLLAPAEAQTVEQQREHLEVIVLLVAHDIYHLVDRIVSEAHLCGADVLRHIHARAVAAQQKLLVEAVV